jgi:hypothetical protein
MFGFFAAIFSSDQFVQNKTKSAGRFLIAKAAANAAHIRNAPDELQSIEVNVTDRPMRAPGDLPTRD